MGDTKIELSELEVVFLTINEKVSQNYELSNDVNCGGCGWFCYFLMRELYKRGITEGVDLIYLDDGDFNDSSDIEYNLENCTGKRSASHLMVRVGELYIDALSTSETVDWLYWDEEEEFVVKTKLEYLLQACQNPSDWNKQYDPLLYNDLVEEIVVEAFLKHGL